ncbi:interferon-induced protein 44-like isoform X1 [Hypanus sabinus]|uniref:interferon-induced protein 44-like isoform X1 n=1 Tax=Hypanus sabinus TaxID=79690 RepID=UPI0028C45AE4|nr:interferon-induced protein 44-like isoform X1 [Hypanus sabinus]
MGSKFSKNGCFHFPTMDKRNLDTLKDYLCNYNPPGSYGDCINILLVGMVGAGKSSLINTFLSALDPQGVTMTCVPTGMNPRSLTKELRYYRAGNLKFWDTAGWNALEHNDQTIRVLQMILEGRIPKGTNLHSFNPESDVANYSIIPENVIHGVTFIFNIDTTDLISEDKMKVFQEIQMIVAEKHVHRVVIGTKFETLGIPEKHNVRVYEYEPLQRKFQNLAERTGMDRRSMFVVSNQWKGGHIEMIQCILALYVLDNMVRNIDRLLKAVQ